MIRSLKEKLYGVEEKRLEQEQRCRMMEQQMQQVRNEQEDKVREMEQELDQVRVQQEETCRKMGQEIEALKKENYVQKQEVSSQVLVTESKVSNDTRSVPPSSLVHSTGMEGGTRKVSNEKEQINQDKDKEKEKEKEQAENFRFEQTKKMLKFESRLAELLSSSDNFDEVAVALADVLTFTSVLQLVVMERTFLLLLDIS